MYGLDEKLCLKVAAAFGGGMGLSRGFCGAVTAALMIIGLKYGGSVDMETRQKINQCSQDFIKKFSEKNRSLVCSELLGIDITTMEGGKEAFDKKVFENKCPGFISDAVNILETIL